MRTHKSEVQAIRKLIEIYGGAAYLLHQGTRLYGSAGLPDLFCMIDRRAFWIEVKVGRDSLRLAQSAFIEHAQRCGQVVIVGGLELVKKWIETWR